MRRRCARRSARRPRAGGPIAPDAVAGGRHAGRADPLPPAAAQHARRSLLESRGAAVMPIFDQGYQHWNGELTSHAWRWWAITRHGVRVGMKNRFLRLMIIVAWLPAVALA